MEGELSLQINLNLQKLSMISVATALWQTSDIKQEIRNAFRHPHPLIFDDEQKERSPSWYKSCYTVARKVIQNKNLLSLPGITSETLEQVIIYVGENLFDWVDHVTEVMGLSYSYAENVYWTCTGMIDEEKIYRTFWRPTHNLDLRHISFFKARNVAIYVLASIYADQTFLQDSILEMTNEINRIFPEVNINNYNDKIYTFMSLWLYLNFKDKVRGFRSITFSRTDYIIPPMFMLVLCVEETLNIAAEYFFSKLNINDQQQCALDRAKAIGFQTSRKYGQIFKQSRLTHYKLKKSSEMVTFFIKNMENDQRHNFLTIHHPNVINAFLRFWMFPELAMSFINFNWPQIIAEDEDEGILIDFEYSNLLGSIMIHIEGDMEADCPVRKAIFKTVSYRVWERIPNNLKFRVIKASRDDSEGFICKMFNVFDFDFMRYILNDPNIAESVDYLLSRAATKCSSLIRIEEYYLVTQFITDVVPLDKKDNFLRRINLLEKLIKRDKFDIAEQILSILSVRHGTKTVSQFKSEINGPSICHKLVEEREFDLANKYINWQFDTEEERKTFRAAIKSDVEVIRRIIQNIWKDKRFSRDVIKKRCFDCLMFYCESNEEEVKSFSKENKFDLLENDSWRNLILGL